MDNNAIEKIEEDLSGFVSEVKPFCGKLLYAQIQILKFLREPLQ